MDMIIIITNFFENICYKKKIVKIKLLSDYEGEIEWGRSELSDSSKSVLFECESSYILGQLLS